MSSYSVLCSFYVSVSEGDSVDVTEMSEAKYLTTLLIALPMTGKRSCIYYAQSKHSFIVFGKNLFDLVLNGLANVLVYLLSNTFISLSEYKGIYQCCILDLFFQFLF